MYKLVVGTNIHFDSDSFGYVLVLKNVHVK